MITIRKPASPYSSTREIVASSVNLRGVITYAQKHKCERVDINRLPESRARAHFWFGDGAHMRLASESSQALGA